MAVSGADILFTGSRETGKDTALLRLVWILGFLAVFGITASLAVYPIEPYKLRVATVLLVLAIVSDFWPIRLGSGDTAVTSSFPIIFAGVLFLGPSLAAFVDAGCIIGASVFVRHPLIRRLTKLDKLPIRIVAFNACQMTLCSLLAAHTHLVLEDVAPIWGGVIPVIGAMGVYLIVNLIVQTFGQAAHSGQTLNEALLTINRAALVLYPTSFWIGWILAAGLQKYGLITLTGLWVPWFVARTLLVNHTKLQGSYRDALRTLVKLLQSFDPRTRRHVERVAKLAMQVADELGLPQNARRDLEDAALLHDIGKIRLDEAVLNKVGKPSPAEWEEIMRHPQLGYEILSEMKPFRRVAELVLCHHERPDGNGYPQGLREKDIPLESSIIAVADAFEVMTARFAGGDHRSYQPSFMADQALERLKAQAGTQFVGSVVFALERVLRRHGMVD